MNNIKYMFASWLSLTILSKTNRETIKIFRNIEDIVEKLVKRKHHIKFNKFCLLNIIKLTLD
jgi:hypothetical protein